VNQYVKLQKKKWSEAAWRRIPRNGSCEIWSSMSMITLALALFATTDHLGLAEEIGKKEY
jgi:hypothetical protein